MTQQSSGSIALADQVGALQSRADTADFLSRHPPYDAVARDVLIQALAGATLTFYARGETLFTPADGVPEHFCVVMQGLVKGVRPEESEDDRRVFEAGPGETFLNIPLQQERATTTVHEAAQDSFVLEIPRPGFALLMEHSAAFADFCQRRASVLIDQARQHLKLESSRNATSGLSLDSTLLQLIRGEPVVCSPEDSVAAAVRRMHERRVGSIVALDSDARPIGMFTLHDLRAVVAAGQDLELPIGTVMTPDPVSIDHNLPAFEAAMRMVDHQIGHLPVVDAGRLVGVVSQRDLFALQRVDAVQLLHEIERADQPARLAELQGKVQDLVHAMLAHGASPRQLTRLITRINDATVQRVITLVQAEWHEELPEFTWLAFGSEARGEQTFSTDQDNGLMFESGQAQSVESVRQRFLPFARRINEDLDRVGFPLCRGQVMGSNPALCLSRDEWRDKFHAIIDECSADNLLRATILFDSRAIAGPAEPLLELRRDIGRRARRNTQFLHALAQHALEWRPPLGLIRSFVTVDTAEGSQLDLKKSGLQIFVSAARVLALAEGVEQNNTEDRLQAVARVGRIRRSDAEAWCEAFSFIQQLRMRRHQSQAAAGQALGNELDPDTLNPLDRRILKEAFRQARRLQTRLKLDYA